MRCVICDALLPIGCKIDLCQECTQEIAKVFDEEIEDDDHE